jgi:VanZ like family
MRPALLGFLGFAILCITLTLGLWPFHAPRNDVTWLKSANGLVFGKYGTVLSSGTLRERNSQDDNGHTIEIRVLPDRWNSATLLTLYNPENATRFALRQSLSDLELVAEANGSRKVMYVDEALSLSLRQKKPVDVTVTSGQAGTRVYIDGLLARAVSQFQVRAGSFAGRLILGDSPLQPDSFRGEILGLAIYGVELDPARPLRHYETWTAEGRPEIVPGDRNQALFLFNEHAGRTVRNQAMASCDLYIPEKYEVVDKIRLEPFWKEFEFTRSYWSGNLKNVVGFLPLGAFFYFYFRTVCASGRAMLATVALGAFVSLTIEVLQAFLPTRDSGTTDLITNTLGTCLGVLCYKVARPFLEEAFPWLGTFAQPRR